VASKFQLRSEAGVLPSERLHVFSEFSRLPGELSGLSTRKTCQVDHWMGMDRGPPYAGLAGILFIFLFHILESLKNTFYKESSDPVIQ